MNTGHGDYGSGRPVRRGEPVFNLPAIIVLLIAVCALVHVLQVYFLTDQQYLEMLARGAFIPIRYSGRFELDIYAFTTPFTYTFIHGSLAHVAINMIWLAVFGSPLANRLGNGRFLLFWALTGLAAIGLHYVLHPLDTAPVIGASGAISGMMGAAARFGFNTDRAGGRPTFNGLPLPVGDVLRSRTVLAFLAVWMVINLASGLGSTASGGNPIAWEAHIGGFLAGFLGIGLFVRHFRL